MTLVVGDVSLFSFDAFYTELRLNERVEDVLAETASRFSSLQTLTEGYKVFLKRHKEWLVTNYSNVLPTCRQSWEEFNREITASIEEIGQDVDIIAISEKKEKFDEKVNERRGNSCVVSDALRADAIPDHPSEDTILSTLAMIKKKNQKMLRRIHPHTQELCFRLMNAAEEMRENRRSFSKTIEDTITTAKADLQQMAITKFQLARMEKLREVCAKLKAEENDKYARKIGVYSEVLERLRFIQDRVGRKESEKNKLLAELRLLPTTHLHLLEEKTARNDTLLSKQNKLEQRICEMAAHIKPVEEHVGLEKQHLLEERGRLQAALAKEKAVLCQMVKHCKIHGIDIVIPGANICPE